MEKLTRSLCSVCNNVSWNKKKSGKILIKYKIYSEFGAIESTLGFIKSKIKLRDCPFICNVFCGQMLSMLMMTGSAEPKLDDA